MPAPLNLVKGDTNELGENGEGDAVTDALYVGGGIIISSSCAYGRPNFRGPEYLART